MKKILPIFIFTMFISCSSETKTNIQSDKAVIFGANSISTHLNERDFALSKDGNTAYFSISISRNQSVICKSEKVENTWQKPEIVSFSGEFMDIEPVFHPDGRLFFVSNRPKNDSIKSKDFDIWYVSPKENGWSEPVNIGSPINTPGNEFYPTFTKNGDMNFTATYEHGIGGEDLWLSEFKDGKFQTPVNLGDSINTKTFEYNSLISPNGDYIIFTGHGWGEGFGNGDLFISFKKNGYWTKAQNLGEKVNSDAFEFCPALSADGKYFFFTRRAKVQSQKSKWTYEEIYNNSLSTENGLGDIFAINADFIEEFRPN